MFIARLQCPCCRLDCWVNACASSDRQSITCEYCGTEISYLPDEVQDWTHVTPAKTAPPPAHERPEEIRRRLRRRAVVH